MIVFMFLGFMFHDVGAVFYGQLAVPGQFKYQALLNVRRKGEIDICGGAIIDERHILTAWHCVEDVTLADIDVIVGAVKYTNDPNAKLHHVSKIKLHESRSCGSDQLRCYDIAVVTVTESIEYNDYVEEIPLPDSDITFGDDCVYAGWGATDEIPDDGSEELRYGYGKIWHTLLCTYRLGSLEDYEFCFRHLKDSRTKPGGGDSGGPFVCDGVLTGVISRGGIDAVTPTTAINVYRLRSFIRDVGSDDCNVQDQNSEAKH